MRSLHICAVLVLMHASAFAADVWSGKVAKEFASGTGSSENPFIIKNAEQFALMAEKYSESLYYRLDDDIVLNSGVAKDWAKSAPKNIWKVYGDSAKPSVVHLDGAGHSVSGLYINSDKNFQGLFGVWQGTVKNLSIKNAYVKGRNSVGALAGAFLGEGVSVDSYNIQNVNADAIVEGENVVGGLAGSAGIYWGESDTKIDSLRAQYPKMGKAALNNVSVSGSVVGDSLVGGVIGLWGANNNKGVVFGVINRASVKGNVYVAGLVARYYISHRDNYAVFSDNINYGNVEGVDYVSGVLGAGAYEWAVKPSEKTSFANCINFGNVSGEKYVSAIYLSVNYNGGYGYNAGVVKIKNELIPDENCSNWHYNEATGDEKCSNWRSYNFSKVSSDTIRKYVDSLGAHFIPDTGKTLLNNGLPLLAYFHQDLIYDHGSGTKDDPYLIKNLHDLRRFEHHVDLVFDSSRQVRYFRQEADIELPKGGNNWAPAKGWFIHYDGNGHSISNMTIVDPKLNVDSLLSVAEKNNAVSNKRDSSFLSDIGFFRSLQESVVRSLTLRDVEVVGESRVGALWAGNGSGNNFSDIVVSGSVSGLYNVGGIAGRTAGSHGTFFNVTNYADVKGIQDVCGIADDNVYYARNYGNVKGFSLVGGIAAVQNNSDIRYVYNRGSVAGHELVGGLVGSSDGRGALENGYNAAEVTGSENVGSIIGKPAKNDTIAGSLLYDSSLSLVPALGGDNVVSVDSSVGVDSKTLKSAASVKTLGGLFAVDDGNKNDGYPVLSFFEGIGSEESPYIIDSAEKLWLLSTVSNVINGSKNSLFAQFVQDKHFKVTADIDLKTSKENPWVPLFCPRNQYGKFVGTFDGGGHVISGIYTDSLENSGLFATNYGTIKNLGIAKSTIRGKSAGAVVGINSGIVENCWNDGSAVKGNIAGGIVGTFEADFISKPSLVKGLADSKIYIDRCYNAGDVYGTKLAGGLVGYISLSTDVYNATFVDSRNYVSVVNSYNVGNVKSDKGSAAALVAGIKPLLTRSDAMFTLKNLYNTVDVCAASTAAKCSPTAIIDMPQTVYVKNVFYLGAKQEGVVGEAKNSKEMKSKEFVDLLGNAFAQDTKGVNNGYPVFSGKSVFRPDQYENDQVRIDRTYRAPAFRGLQVSTAGREIHLDNVVKGARTFLYDLRGNQLWSGVPVANGVVIPVQKPGMYIVKNKFQMAKILIGR